MNKFITVFLLAFSFNALAVDFGVWSCGKVVQWERDNNKMQMDAISLWFAGYIAGRNLGEEVSKFEDYDIETLFLLISNECRAEPSLSTYFAAYRIYNRGY